MQLLNFINLAGGLKYLLSSSDLEISDNYSAKEFLSDY